MVQIVTPAPGRLFQDLVDPRICALGKGFLTPSTVVLVAGLFHRSASETAIRSGVGFQPVHQLSALVNTDHRYVAAVAESIGRSRSWPKAFSPSGLKANSPPSSFKVRHSL